MEHRKENIELPPEARSLQMGRAAGVVIGSAVLSIMIAAVVAIAGVLAGGITGIVLFQGIGFFVGPLAGSFIASRAAQRSPFFHATLAMCPILLFTFIDA